jgi:hypothetical protein
MNTIYDTILWLESKSCGKRFPVVLFSADTDMATAAWVALTSTERPEVVVTQMTVEEYNANERGFPLVEARVNRSLSRTDLRHVPLIRVEDTAPGDKGQTFQEFKKTYRPRKCIYRDIYDPRGEAEEKTRESREHFESAGGRVVLLA